MLKVRLNEAGEWVPMPNPRRAQAKWDRRHLITVSTHLTRKQRDSLCKICNRQHVTVYALVRDFLLDYIRAHADA